MRRNAWREILRDALWIGMASVTMGTFVAVAHFADYGPMVTFDVGETVIGIPLIVGIVLGLLLSDDEPQSLVFKGFGASLGAIVIVAFTVYAPVLANVVQNLDDLGVAETARLASLFISLFIVPIHLVGNVIGRGVAEVFPSISS